MNSIAVKMILGVALLQNKTCWIFIPWYLYRHTSLCVCDQYRVVGIGDGIESFENLTHSVYWVG